MCISPLTLIREVSTIDGNRTNVVPCGKCPECLRARANAWAFRIYQEMKHSSFPKFITLTYENAPQTFNGLDTLHKKDFQDFMKRLRKATTNKLKYYACGEYGTETERPHYHLLLLNQPKLWTLDPKYIEKHWKHGQIHIGDANMKTIHYTLKYMMKGKTVGQTELDDRQNVFSLMSKGMGIQYLTEAQKTYLTTNKHGFITLEGGIKAAMPKYYKDKIYTQSQKAQIAKAAKAAAELNPKFKTAWNEVQWKNDLIRKTDKKNSEKGTL